MPIVQTSYVVPSSPSIPYLVEDIYFKGGFRVVADAIARDAIKAQAKKVGMLVLTALDGKIWQLQEDKISWVEFKSGGGTQTLIGEAPISVKVNGNIVIDPQYVIPSGGETGDYIVKNIDGSPIWKPINLSGISGNRVIGTWVSPSAIEPADTVEFFVAMSNTLLLLELSADIPQVKVEIFTTSARTEPNPYTFISSNLNPSDQGITEQTDGSLLKGRRFSILANLEQPPSNLIYWRVTNLAPVPITPTLHYTYLTLQ